VRRTPVVPAVGTALRSVDPIPTRSVACCVVSTAASAPRLETARCVIGHVWTRNSIAPPNASETACYSREMRPGLKKRDMIRLKTDPPRSILHVRPSELEGVARYWPSPDLEPFVEDYWVVRWDRLETAETVPQPCMHLVLHVGASEVVGVARSRFTRVLTGRGRMLGAKFRPGAFRAFLDVPAWHFAGKALPVADVFGPQASTLEARALAREDDRESLALVEEFLRDRRPSTDESIVLAGRIVARIASDHGITRVDQLTQEFGIGSRSLQRLFREYVGASPKWVVQSLRLLDATDRVTRGEVTDWADLALELGYADQAHFIRDFKRLVGRSPVDYTRSLRNSSDR